MTLLATVFTTQAEMERKIGTQAVLDLSDHEVSGAPDDDVIDDAINQATEEISLTAGQRYGASGLSGSQLIRRWATTLACCFLFQNRGNPIPMSLQAEFERIMARLERVMTGAMQLTGVAMIGDLRPTMSNRTIDRRYATRTVRTQRRISTDAPSKLRRHFDQDYGFHE
jgi:phage gp36-like protein